MVPNKSTVKIEYGLGIIVNDLIESLIEDLSELSLDPEVNSQFVQYLISKKNPKINITDANNPLTKKTRSKSTKSRVVADYTPCNRLSKAGKECKGRANKYTGSCWIHMNSEEREEAKDRKAAKENGEPDTVPPPMSHDEKRRLEDMVHE